MKPGPAGVGRVLQALQPDIRRAFLRKKYHRWFPDLVGAAGGVPLHRNKTLERLDAIGEILPWVWFHGQQVEEMWMQNHQCWFGTNNATLNNMDLPGMIAHPKVFVAQGLSAFVWREGAASAEKRRQMDRLVAHGMIDFSVGDKLYARVPLRMITNVTSLKALKGHPERVMLRGHQMEVFLPGCVVFSANLRAPWGWWQHHPRRMPSGIWLMLCLHGLLRRPRQ